ncbi:MAG: MBL fold metallo-hydrolase, partial [Acidimicrobiales bacterium]
MLTEVAAGVYVRQSAFCRTNTTVVVADRDALVVDPGVTVDDLTHLAHDLDRLGVTVALGFATHPHWDHVLWHERLGPARREATAACARTARALRPRLLEEVAEHAPGVDPALVGRLHPLERRSGTLLLAWAGPAVEVVEHRGHAPGHAALLVREAGVVVAGDMLSDVEIPLLDPDGEDPVGDYADALGLLGDLCGGAVAALVPG